MASKDPYRDLARVETSFARSGRRSSHRREHFTRRNVVRGVLAGILASTVAALAVSGEINGLATGAPEPERAEAPACPLPERFREDFADASSATGVDLPLLVAVAEAESELDPDALSSAGAQGLLQVMPSTALEVSVANNHQPRGNVLAGARYLRRMLDRFGSEDVALAAYNAGPAAVDRAGGVAPAFAQPYVTQVTERRASLGSCR